MRLFNQNSFYGAVHWRSGRTEDELELLRNDQSTSRTVTDDVRVTEISILNYKLYKI